MDEKYIPYSVDGRSYKIPESKSAEFEKTYPEATIRMTAEDRVYNIPFSKKNEFMSTYPEATYAFKTEEPKDEQHDVTLGETIKYSLGNVGTTLAKGIWDWAVQDASRGVYKDDTGKVERHKDYDSMIRDNDYPIQISKKLGAKSQEFSRKADPTGGEKDYIDLIKEGSVGTILQKSLGDAIQSAPATVAAQSPLLILPYTLMNAASNYADQSINNPDIPKWKRGTYALASAVFEQTVERFENPFKGKAAKELTEDAAKKILNEGVSGGFKKITSRIVDVLKRIGKGAKGEAIEEGVTSFGNDAIGQALDWIDGNSDYGFTAQWEALKKENPDANMWDFASEKAREYLNAAIGGGLSGAHMSGPSQIAHEIGSVRSEKRGRDVVDSARAIGETWGYADIYNANEEVANATAKAAQVFVDESGNPTLGEDFISSLSSEDAFNLSQKAEISDVQSAALLELSIAKAQQEGMVDNMNNAVKKYVDNQRAIIDSATENGNIVMGLYNNTPVYVIGGVVNNGSVTLPNGEAGPVVVVDVNTGDKTSTRSENISSAMSENALDFGNNKIKRFLEDEERIREEFKNTVSPAAKLRDVQQYAGKKILLNGDNGTYEVLVQQVLPEGKVIVKGKKGDLGGQSIVTMDAASFYDSIYRDEAGSPVITDAPAEDLTEPTIDETVETPQPEITGQEDFRGETVTLLINGAPTQVEVTSQDNTSDSITYEYVDANGRTRTGSSTISDFINNIQQTPAVESEPIAEEAPETTVTEEDVIEEAPIEETSLTPESIDWDALFEQDTEAFFAELQKQFGPTAIDIINGEIEAADAELKTLEKTIGKTMNERVANLSKIASLRLRKGILEEMAQRLNEKAEEDIVVEETVEQPVENEPVAETPAEPEVTIEPVEAPIAEESVETPVESEPVAEQTPVEEAPVNEEPVAETPIIEEVQPRPIAVAPNPVDNPVAEAKKREAQLLTLLEKAGVSNELKEDAARRAGKEVADMFATREDYEQYEAEAADLGEFIDFFDEGVNESFASRKEQAAPVESQGISVPLEAEPKAEENGAEPETADGEDTIRQGDDTVGGGTVDGGVETADTGNQETEQIGKGESESVEEVKKEYPKRKGDATRKLLIDTFGFAKVSIPNTESKVLNTVYDFMMEMSKMLGVSPNVIGNGGWLDVANLRSNANASASYNWKNRSDGTVVEPRLKLKYGRISSIAHEWWHSLDHVLKFFNTGKGRQTATYNIGSLDAFGVRTEVKEALADLLKSMKDSGFEARISSMKLPLKYKFYLLENEEMTARAFDAYINDKFTDAGIEVENAVYERTPYQPTPEEMAVIAPAFDNLFNVLKEKEGLRKGTSVLYQIRNEMGQNTEAKKELGLLVSEWIKQGGNLVIMDTAQMSEALEKEGLSQNAKRRNRTIFNRDLTPSEKTAIQKYILSLPENYVQSMPYTFEYRGKVYVFNTSRRFYAENTTQNPIGDGFEILHRIKLSEISDAEKALINRYTNDRNSQNLARLLQLLESKQTRGNLGSSNTQYSRTETGNDGLDASEHRVESSTSGRDNSGRRDSKESRALETRDGIIYGFVKDGVVYLDPSLLNPNTAIHEYTHLWDNALMQLNRPLWEKGKALMKQTPFWNEVINDPYYEDIRDDEDLVASEVHSRLVGEDGEERLNQIEQQLREESLTKSAKKLSILGRMREWLAEATKWLKDSFAKWTNAEIESVTLDDFVNLTMRDLVNFTNLSKKTKIKTKEQIREEKESIKEMAIANGTFMKAPNGQPTKLSEDQWLTVRTESFINWFGDWMNDPENASKVVDENGEPMVVYHGSPYGNITEFNRKGHSVSGLREFGTYFGSNRRLAELYAYARQQAKGDVERYELEKAKIDAIIFNPDTPPRVALDAFDELDKLNESQKPKVYEVFLNIRNPKEFDAERSDGYRGWHKLKQDVGYDIKTGVEAIEAIAGHNNAARMSEKYDGIIAHNIADVHHEEGLDELIGDVFLVFDETPSNIKSANGNTSFDSENPNIHFQIVGKNGAYNLDIEAELGEGVAYRMNALELAEQLESEGFDKRQIKTATGWERGYDGKWRYEIDDLIIKDNIKLKRGMTLGDIAENNELFKAYPFLADIEVRKMTTKEVMETDADGAYIEDDNTIIVRIKNEDGILGIDEWEVLVHEVQHAIQRYEGFTTGASESFVRRNAHEILREEEKKAKPLYDRMGERERQLADEIREEVYAQLPKRMSKRDKEIALRKAVDKAKFNDAAFESIRQQWLPYAKRIQTLKILTGNPFHQHRREDPMVIWDLYKSYAGEVEARNAVDRMYLSPDERAEKTLEETEDTPREHQIAIGESSGIAEARKIADTENILYNIPIDPETISRETAKEVYDRVVNQSWQEFQREFQDAYQPVRIAIEAIQQETGNIPIEDYENYLLIQNQSSSRSRVEIDNFERRYYSPIIGHINSIIDKLLETRGLDKHSQSARAEAYQEVVKYLIAKHGIERNKYYQSKKKRNLKQSEQDKEIKEAQNVYDEMVRIANEDTSLSDSERDLAIRKAQDELDAAITEIKTRQVPDLRDYSGLTSLFGKDPKDFRKAEADAQEFVDSFENLVDTSELWQRINAATDKTLRHSYECGLLSRKQYNDIKNMFEFYIPLRGFDETTAEDVYSYARFEGNRFNPAVQTAQGRTSIADDPIAIIMNMAESEIAQGNKNRAKQALYNFLLNRGVMGTDGEEQQNSLMKIEDVWYVESVDDSGATVYTIASPNHEAGETYEEFENRMNNLADSGKAYKSKKGRVDLGMRFQKVKNKSAHYVYLKVNGVEKAIYINGDPKAADAINGVYAKQLGEGAKKFRDAQRIISSMFTNYSPEFTVRNYFRDLLYSHINIDIKEPDAAYRKKFRQNWRHNNMGTMIKLLNAYHAGKFEDAYLTEDEAAFVEFMNNGGQTGYTLINSVENHKKDLEKAIERMKSGIEHGGIKDTRVLGTALKGIELLNEASELVTRFAAYKTSRDMGRSVAKSISDAKEITVNFNTKGAQDGNGWMGAVAQYFGWSKYFFNASIQGVQNIKAMADANRLKFCSTVGSIAALGFMTPIITSLISQMFGDDDEEYWNIPEYDRQNNFCFTIPFTNGKYAKVPLPIGFREVYALGDMVAAMMFDKKFSRDFGQVGMDMANKIVSVVLPINPLESMANGLSIWATIGNTILPSSAQFVVQNWTNVDWKGAPLQKEYTYNENDPQWMKAFANNPAWMKTLSKWCNENINLDGDYKGMDWSPEKLDNILSNLGGGIYTVIKKMGKSVSMIWNEENRNLYNVPLAGVFVGSGANIDDRFVTDAYYDMQSYYDNNVNYIKRRAEKFGLTLDDVFLKEKGKHHPKMLEIYTNSNFDFMQEWYKGNDVLKDMNREIKKLKNKISETEKPSTVLLNKLASQEGKFEAERREFVNDMLELD